MANGRKLNEVTNVSTLASSDRLVSVRTADGHTVQISLTAFMNTLPAGSILTATIGDEQVTNAKLEERVATSVMGRSANSAGAPGDIAAAANNQVLKRKSNALVFGQVETDDIAAQAVTSDEIDMSDLIGALISSGTGTLSSSNAGISSSVVRYTQIGNMVFVYARASFSNSHPTPSGNLNLNLVGCPPIRQTNSGHRYQFAAIMQNYSHSSFPAGAHFVIESYEATAGLIATMINNSGGAGTAPVSGIGSSTVLRFSGWYLTDEPFN